MTHAHLSSAAFQGLAAVLRPRPFQPRIEPEEGWLMANPKKHKRNLVSEFLGDDDAGESVQLRSVHLTGAQDKAAKAVPRRSRPPVAAGPAPKPDPALAREPAKLKPEERTSQAHSPEHLRKLQRLPKLRAPYSNPGHRAG
jgi:hypothetical protein